jgi:predicted nucleic-acid-binding protein
VQFLLGCVTAQSPGFITLVSVVELVWVLSSAYALDRGQVVQVLDIILRSKQLVVDRAEHVLLAVRAYGQV